MQLLFQQETEGILFKFDSNHCFTVKILIELPILVHAQYLKCYII